MKRILAVVPRYGEGLGGGAETLIKELLEHYPGSAEVYTTCALDHRTWQNCLPPGRAEVNGIPVTRFTVDPRDTSKFLEAEFKMRDGRRLTVDEQLNWLSESVNSRDLYRQLARSSAEFDLILFAPYLFATTFWGSMMVADKAVLIPCLHDEHYAYQDVFRAMFDRCRGIIFNTAAEQRLAEELYNLPGLTEKSQVVGMGFADRVVPRTAPLRPRPYLLYSGRKEQGKNLDLLLSFFERFPSDELGLDLVLIGSGEINFREGLPPNTYDLGFVSEEDKSALLANAIALCQPSMNESFSIVLMEAWRVGTPVIVHGGCRVTREHAVCSNGGLYFTNYEEFEASLKLLLADQELRDKLGSNGARYVATEYSWDAVTRRFVAALDKFAAQEHSEVTL